MCARVGCARAGTMGVVCVVCSVCVCVCVYVCLRVRVCATTYVGSGGRSCFGLVPSGPLPQFSTRMVLFAAANRDAYLGDRVCV